MVSGVGQAFQPVPDAVAAVTVSLQAVLNAHSMLLCEAIFVTSWLQRPSSSCLLSGRAAA
jgi:hypothetical protein